MSRRKQSGPPPLNLQVRINQLGYYIGSPNNPMQLPRDFVENNIIEGGPYFRININGQMYYILRLLPPPSPPPSPIDNYSDFLSSDDDY